MRSYGIRICALLAAFGAAAFASTAFAAKEIKIGVIYDYTGPLAAGGSKAAADATKIAIDMINEKGGVDGYKIVPIYADAQSKVDVAINEATRLMDEQHVDMLMGFFSSAQCVPIAQKADAQKLFTWYNVCIASSVFKNKNLKLRVPRPASLRPDRKGGLHFREGDRAAQAAQGGEGRARGDHPRGRALRQRRGGGQRRGLRRGRHGHRAEGRLLRHRARSLVAHHQAAPRAARRDPAHRLQPGHHAVLAPGARAGPQVGRPDRPGRGLRPVRQAARLLRQRSQLHLRRRSGGRAAARRRRRSSPGWAI